MQEDTKTVIKAIALTGIAFAASVALAFPTHAATAHEQAMSYILADQDLPERPGDILYMSEKMEECPILVETTGYHQGVIGSHGDRMRKGYCAYTPEHYGTVLMIYEAIPTDDGYSMGGYITMLEVRDCGYGKPTGVGKSTIRPDKKSKGSIELGKSVDVYYPTLSECKEWMKKTQGMCFIQIVPGKG